MWSHIPQSGQTTRSTQNTTRWFIFQQQICKVKIYNKIKKGCKECRKGFLEPNLLPDWEGTEADMGAGMGAGIGAATGWGTFLTGPESSRGIGVIFNFPGDLVNFALIAYRLFWNQFQT